MGVGFEAAPESRQSQKYRLPTHGGMVAGDEKGLVASATNMTRALRSLVPLLDTCIGVSGACPSMG